MSARFRNVSISNKSESRPGEVDKDAETREAWAEKAKVANEARRREEARPEFRKAHVRGRRRMRVRLMGQKAFEKAMTQRMREAKWGERTGAAVLAWSALSFYTSASIT